MRCELWLVRDGRVRYIGLEEYGPRAREWANELLDPDRHPEATDEDYVMITVANRRLGADAKEIVTPKRTAMRSFPVPRLW